MGRLLRDRKLNVVSAKRTRAQSHLSNEKAKTPRHALSDKTNSRGDVFPGKNILPLSLITTRSRRNCINTSYSENDSPIGNFLGKRAKLQSNTSDEKHNCIENDLHAKIISAKSRARRTPLGNTTNSSESDSPVHHIVSERKAKGEENKSLSDVSNSLDSDSSGKKTTTMALRRRLGKTTNISESDSPVHHLVSEKKAKGEENKSLTDVSNSLDSDSSEKKTTTMALRRRLGKTTNSSESDSPVHHLVSEKKAKVEENKSLTDVSNSLDSDSSGKKTTTMALRRRNNQKPSTEKSLFGKLLPNKLKSFNNNRICSPRALSASKKQTFSCLDLSSNRLSNAFVQLDNISELVKIHNENKKLAKKPIYQTISEDNNKTDTEMLPEEKIKLYEYEVDANSPKKVAVKRKRKPRKRKVVASECDWSNDEGNFPVGSVIKSLSTLSKSLPLRRKAVEVNSSKTNTVNPNDAKVFSPFKSSDRLVGSTSKNVKFADKLPSASSTPNTSEIFRESAPFKALKFPQKEISSPVPKVIPRRQIKKSIYVNPAEILELNSPDISVASEVSTTEKDVVNLMNSPSQSLKQTKINSFFLTSARSGNDTNEVENHNNSGLFDEPPSRSNSESMSTTAASAASQFITMRRKAMYHARPRISGFEQIPECKKQLPPMTVENCFGFDDDNDVEDNFIPPSIQHRSLPLSVPFRAVCSTPITAPQPTRICIQARTKPVPKKTVKLASPPRPSLHRPMPLPAMDPSAASTSEYTSQSPPLILSDPETLMPVTFGDEPSNFFKPARRSYQRTPKPRRDYAETATDEEDEILAVVKKPKKKGKQYLRKKKQEEDNWASSINRQFEEIEDMDLVVE